MSEETERLAASLAALAATFKPLTGAPPPEISLDTDEMRRYLATPPGPDGAKITEGELLDGPGSPVYETLPPVAAVVADIDEMSDVPLPGHAFAPGTFDEDAQAVNVPGEIDSIYDLQYAKEEEEPADPLASFDPHQYLDAQATSSGLLAPARPDEGQTGPKRQEKPRAAQREPEPEARPWAPRERTTDPDTARAMLRELMALREDV